MQKMLNEAVVMWNRPVKSVYYRMAIACDAGVYARALPGQFVMLRLQDSGFPLLRRPFSIHRLLKEKGRLTGFELLYKVVGSGTRCMAKCREGHRVDVLGPLGNGFVFDTTHDRIYLVAGGIGVAPMLFLTQMLVENSPEPQGLHFFLGARSASDLLCVSELRQLGLGVHLATEDGSRGKKEIVSVLLAESLAQARPDAIYACGPRPMLAQVAALAARYDLPCWLSIETMMACGMGACLGCAIKGCDANAPYRHVCIDGPVFAAAELGKPID